MLIDYLRAAMNAALYELLSKEEGFYGEIPGFDGVFADGETLKRCHKELASTLEDWLLFQISRNLPLPKLNGMDLTVKEVAEIQ